MKDVLPCLDYEKYLLAEYEERRGECDIDIRAVDRRFVDQGESSSCCRHLPFRLVFKQVRVEGDVQECCCLVTMRE